MLYLGTGELARNKGGCEDGGRSGRISDEGFLKWMSEEKVGRKARGFRFDKVLLSDGIGN